MGEEEIVSSTIEAWEWEQRVNVYAWEWLFVFFIIIVFAILAIRKKRKMILIHKEYQYYVYGLYARLFGALIFCVIYVYYYNKAGDTIAYFESSMALANLFDQDPMAYFEALKLSPSVEARTLFSDKTGYPYAYLYYDAKTFIIIKLISPITILTGKSFLISSVVVAFVSYIGVWRLFILFYRYFPEIKGRLAFAVLFFPSVLFWGSGILKDTFTLMSTGLFVYSIHEEFIIKNKKFSNRLVMLISAYLILQIKPYILMALLPGTLTWIYYDKLKSGRNRFFLRLQLGLLLVGGIIAFSVFTGGLTSIFDEVLKDAAVKKNDLNQEYYEGSGADIGQFDGSMSGALKLAPKAIVMGLFRPFIWEVNSVMVMLSGIENSFLLMFIFYILWRAGPINFFKLIVKNPLIFFCILFSILFAFIIGLSTSNFGALVRFKIPLIPFFISALFIIEFLSSKKYRNKSLVNPAKNR